MNGQSNVHREINRALADRVSNNAKVIESIANTVLLCGRQNLEHCQEIEMTPNTLGKEQTLGTSKHFWTSELKVVTTF